MIVLCNFFVFEVIEAFELRVASSQSVCSFAQIVSQMMITAFNKALVIGVKIAGLMLSPDRIGIFSNTCLTRKTVNIVNFSNDPCGIYIADTIRSAG